MTSRPPETTNTISLEARERRHGGLILAALAGPIAWSLHFLFIYLLVELACRTGTLSGTTLGLTGLAWVNLAATVVALAVVIGAGVSAFRRWRDRRDGARPPAGGPVEPRTAAIWGTGPEQLLALAGWSLSLVFGVLIVLTALPMLVLAPCPWM